MTIEKTPKLSKYPNKVRKGHGRVRKMDKATMLFNDCTEKVSHLHVMHAVFTCAHPQTCNLHQRPESDQSTHTLAFMGQSCSGTLWAVSCQSEHLRPHQYEWYPGALLHICTLGPHGSQCADA